jgi:[acyl-carrier-protein] S-malonyltransferase
MSHTAAVFAGQGAQAVGMGRDLTEAFPECKALFQRANDVLGFDLAKVCFEGPDTDLTKTNIAQPAIFVVSAACLAALRAKKPDFAFDVAAGLSLGEWTALYAAGVVSFDQAVRILEARGRFMQEACEERAGGMVSVMRLTVEQIQGIATQSGLTMANINSTEQVVLSGPKEGVAAAEAAVKAAGGRAVVLNVAGAYHSPLMASAATKLEGALATETFQAPSVPVVSNVTGQPHGGPDAIRKAMVAQVTGSVRWLDSVNWCATNGIDRYVEFGPGKTLTGLIKRIVPTAAAFNVADAAQADATAAAI